MKRFLSFLLILTLFTLAGCGQAPAPSKTQGTVSYKVTDFSGKEIEFNQKPQRIYCSTPAIEEILLDLVSPEKLVAISQDSVSQEHSLVYDKAIKVTKVTPTFIPVEEIVKLKPDLVIAQNRNKTYIDTLRDLGIKVFVVSLATDLPSIRSRIQMVADVVGETEKGKNVVASMDKKLAYIRTTLEKHKITKKKVVLAYSPGGVFGSKKAFFHHLCENSGVENGAANLGLVMGTYLSKEKIIEANPDFFVFGTDTKKDQTKIQPLMDQLLKDPALSSIKAVKNQQYILIPERYRRSGSQLMGDGALEIAYQAYPEIFKEKYKE